MKNSLNYKSYLILFFVVLVVLFIRIGNINFLDGRYLWAEDGNVFINQALSLGLKSIFKPYNGYIHLYPRLISIITVQFNLFFLPITFFMAWIIAVLYSSLLIFQWIYKQTDSITISIIIPLLIFLQPHSGETFFNITNVQWFLSLALIVVLIDQDYKLNYKNFLIFIVLGLTGPFSIILLPILFLNILLKKDLKENYPKYLVILLTALVQIYFMMQSNRVGGVIDKNILYWLTNLYNFFSFGLTGCYLILSILIWSIVFFCISKIFWNIYQKKITRDQISAILLLISLIAIYFAGVWTTKQSPQGLHPMGGGARYFVIPYALLIISSVFLIKKKLILNIFFSLFFIICILQLNKGIFFNKPNLNYQSFIWLSNYIENTNIPIHPQWNQYPGWHIEIKNKNNINDKAVYSINMEEIKVVNGKKYKNSIEATNNDLQLIFDLPPYCIKSSHIGLEVNLYRTSDGVAQVFYTDNSTGFNEENSLRRYYPAGNITMQFAFKNKNISKVRLDPTEKKELIKINDIKIYCDWN